MVRIAYISRINLLSGRTNVYNLAKTCEALNTQPDFSLKLVTTDQERDKKAFFEKMAIHKPFEIECVGTTDTSSKFSGAFWFEPLMLLVSNVTLIIYILRKHKEFDTIYFRDESLFLTAIFARLFTFKTIFFEIHSVYERPFRQLKNKWSARFSHGVIAISGGLKKYYEKINPNIVVSLCSAVEDSWFDYSKSKEDFRKELGLSLDKYIIGYTGVVGINPNNDYYEIDDVARSLKLLPENIILIAIGELNNNAQWLREIINKEGVLERVKILPWTERSVIMKYLQAFDVNVVPKRKKDLVGDSPAKMFPPMASKRPIVAGRAECIQEVLTDGLDSLIVEKNSPEGWASAISKIYNNPEIGEKISKEALVTKNKYTWEKRGISVSNFIKSIIDNPEK